MKNKIIKISLFLIMVILLITGCNIQSVEEYNDDQLSKSEDTAESSESDSSKNKKDEENVSVKADEKNDKDVKDDDNDKTEKSPDNSAKNSNNEKEKNKDNKTKNKSDSKVNESNKNTSNKSDSNKNTNKSGSQNKPQNKPENKPKPTEKPKPTKKYVTLEIRVDTILDNYDKLDPKLKSERFVPSNGVILKKSKFELKDGENVFDILVKAVRQNRIHMEYQGANENQYGSVYIQGINNIYEFSVGELSGWMYKVNGWYPNYGASLYKLKDGDNISWNYTCDLGRDLGQNWLDK
ncbi:DUF4430 domain-containing protein [Senegalia massiliensis]